jgi:hypothetical protein
MRQNLRITVQAAPSPHTGQIRYDVAVFNVDETTI